jgi:hypothetical protein
MAREAGRGMARRGGVRYGAVRPGMAGQGLTTAASVTQEALAGAVRTLGKVRRALVRCGMARHGVG